MIEWHSFINVIHYLYFVVLVFIIVVVVVHG